MSDAVDFEEEPNLDKYLDFEQEGFWESLIEKLKNLERLQ